jgi:DNA-binding transcriptional MerR regulator
MLKIGDFSRLSQVSVKTLRYYDEVGLLKPTQVDQVSGYRYYSVVQLRQLHRILALRDLGFSLDQIGYVLEADLSTEELRGMLRVRRAEQQQRLIKEQECLERVEALLQLIHQENTTNTDAVIIKDTEPQRFASIRKTIPAYNQVGQLFGALFRDFPGSAARGPCFAIWHDDEHKDQDVDAEACVPVDEKYQGLPTIRCADLPTVKVASVIHHGAYNTLTQSYQMVPKWVEANGYQVQGPIREIYLQCGEPLRQDDDSYVTEIQVPIALDRGGRRVGNN